MARMRLDDFKVNDDRYGYPVGDVLKNFAIGVSRQLPRTANEIQASHEVVASVGRGRVTSAWQPVYMNTFQ